MVGTLSHASVTHYLLEKSRVVISSKKEQGYHAPYYLCCANDPAAVSLREKLLLHAGATYNFLPEADPALQQGFDAEFVKTDTALLALQGEGCTDRCNAAI